MSSTPHPGRLLPGSPSALVDPAALGVELASARPPLLLDVRWTLAGPDPAAHRAGHLPGAVFVDLDAELAAPPGDGGRHPLPSSQALTALLRRVGAGTDRSVVVYDAGGSSPLAAARAWWCLRYAGHHEVRVLDGGLAGWKRTGRAVEVGDVPAVPDHAALARPGGMPVIEVEDVAAGAVRLLDVRAPERFSGRSEPIDPVAGHVPGALNLPVTDLLDPAGRVLPAADVRAAVERVLTVTDAGDGEGPDSQPLAPPARPLAASCGSGLTAAVAVLALHEAGLQVALWPGSWSQWVRDPARAVATGA